MALHVLVKRDCGEDWASTLTVRPIRILYAQSKITHVILSVVSPLHSHSQCPDKHRLHDFNEDNCRLRQTVAKEQEITRFDVAEDAYIQACRWDHYCSLRHRTTAVRAKPCSVTTKQLWLQGERDTTTAVRTSRLVHGGAVEEAGAVRYSTYQMAGCGMALTCGCRARYSIDSDVTATERSRKLPKKTTLPRQCKHAGHLFCTLLMDYTECNP